MDDTRALVLGGDGARLRQALAKVQSAARDAATAIRGDVLEGIGEGYWYRLNEEKLALAFRPDTPFEVWEVETRALLEVARGIQWLVGDALAFGEDAYGEQSSQVFDAAEYSYETVGWLARTSKAIPPSRRRPNVSHSVHAAVTGLPETEQEALLDHAEAHGSTREEMRLLAGATRQRLAREHARALPVPQLELGGMVLGQADACALPLPDACVDLIVTSPPYGVEVDYVVGDVEAVAWSAFIEACCREARRVTKLHGRLALNIPLDTARGGFRPTYAEAVMAALAAGWTYHSTILWVDGATTKGNRALGSIDSAARPYHVSQCELIGLFSNGDWGPSSTNPDDITPEQFQEAGRGPWVLPGETHAWEGFPAAFPIEIPRRLIRYLSRVGDTILDPFLGSGTTAVAAYELGRACWGFDLDAGQVDSTWRRLALVRGQRRG